MGQFPAALARTWVRNLVYTRRMSRTQKNSRLARRFLEVVRKDDGTYDLFLDDIPDRSSIPEPWLSEELCVRFGFCGEQYTTILAELNLRGRTRLWLSSS